MALHQVSCVVSSRVVVFRGTPNLPTNIIPTKIQIAWLKLSGKSPMDTRLPPLMINIMLEWNPLTFIMLVRRLAVMQHKCSRLRALPLGGSMHCNTMLCNAIRYNAIQCNIYIIISYTVVCYHVIWYDMIYYDKIYIYIYIYIYIHIHTSLSLSLSISLCIYIYIYIYI